MSDETDRTSGGTSEAPRTVGGFKVRPDETGPYKQGASGLDMLAIRKGRGRFPRIPTREEVPEEDREAWDKDMEMVGLVEKRKVNLKYGHRISGGYFGLMCRPGLVATTVGRYGAPVPRDHRPAMMGQGKPGSFTATDHEFIDMVLCFDAGHWGFLANHVPFAIASGIPVSTVRALRDKREEELSAEDRQIIEFIRAIRDGTITDPMWKAMVTRFGTEAGVCEFISLTLQLNTHVRLMQAFDETQITPDELEDLLGMLERGEYPLPKVLHAGPAETRPVPAHPTQVPQDG